VARTFYRRHRSPGTSLPAPIVVSTDVTIHTSRQTSDELLCTPCEGRFSSQGEHWVSEHCWRDETEFPLRSALQRASPVYRDGTEFVLFRARQSQGWTPQS
jgi:hypothetical protein